MFSAGDLFAVNAGKYEQVCLGQVVLNDNNDWTMNDHGATHIVHGETLGVVVDSLTITDKWPADLGRNVYVVWIPTVSQFGWLWSRELKAFDETR